MNEPHHTTDEEAKLKIIMYNQRNIIIITITKKMKN